MENDLLSEVFVVSSSENKSVNCAIYDFKTYNCLTSFQGGNSTSKGLTFIGRDYIISAFEKIPKMKIWTLSRNHDEDCLMTSPGLVSCLDVTNCGTYCVAAVNNIIYIWEVQTGTLVSTFQFHIKPITCLTISSDGSHVISGSEDGSVLALLLTNAVTACYSEDLKPRFSWTDHCGEITDIYAKGGGIYARVVTSSKDMTSRVYELVTGFLLLTIRVDYGITAVAMDQLEYFLALGSAEGEIYRINLFSTESSVLEYDKPDRRSVFSGHSLEVTCLSVSATGRKLLSGSKDKLCKIWDIINFTCLKTIQFSGPITNAFIRLLPPGLIEGREFVPQILVSAFKRQYDKEDENTLVKLGLHERNLSLFHLGSSDEYFSPRLLVDSEVTNPNALNNTNVNVRDVTCINSQMYSYALCDTFSDIAMSPDVADDNEDESDN